MVSVRLDQQGLHVKTRYKLFLHPIEAIGGLWYHYRARLYDWRRGIETGKRNVGVPYDPTEPKYIRWAFRNLPINPADYSFVDFGSGKGRVLIAAAEHPFLEVIGVEYSKDLHEAAMTNIRSARRIKCTNTRSVCVDAAEFSIPDSPCVLFFYNPFRGETMNRVLSNIQESLTRQPRPIFVVYVNPILHDIFIRQPGMRLVKAGDWCNLYAWNCPGTALELPLTVRHLSAWAPPLLLLDEGPYQFQLPPARVPDRPGRRRPRGENSRHRHGRNLQSHRRHRVHAGRSNRRTDRHRQLLGPLRHREDRRRITGMVRGPRRKQNRRSDRRHAVGVSAVATMESQVQRCLKTTDANVKAQFASAEELVLETKSDS
jgi:SAM-dependent methyltransferase